jgi:hypothetical protein
MSSPVASRFILPRPKRREQWPFRFQPAFSLMFSSPDEYLLTYWGEDRVTRPEYESPLPYGGWEMQDCDDEFALT